MVLVHVGAEQNTTQTGPVSPPQQHPPPPAPDGSPGAATIFVLAFAAIGAVVVLSLVCIAQLLMAQEQHRQRRELTYMPKVMQDAELIEDVSPNTAVRPPPAVKAAPATDTEVNADHAGAPAASSSPPPKAQTVAPSEQRFRVQFHSSERDGVPVSSPPQWPESSNKRSASVAPAPPSVLPLDEVPRVHIVPEHAIPESQSEHAMDDQVAPLDEAPCLQPNAQGDANPESELDQVVDDQRDSSHRGTDQLLGSMSAGSIMKADCIALAKAEVRTISAPAEVDAWQHSESMTRDPAESGLLEQKHAAEEADANASSEVQDGGCSPDDADAASEAAAVESAAAARASTEGCTGATAVTEHVKPPLDGTVVEVVASVSSTPRTSSPRTPVYDRSRNHSMHSHSLSTHQTQASDVEPELARLVGRVISDLAPGAQQRCDIDRVLVKLEELGAYRLEDLRSLIGSNFFRLEAELLMVAPIILATKLREALEELAPAAAYFDDAADAFAVIDLTRSAAIERASLLDEIMQPGVSMSPTHSAPCQTTRTSSGSNAKATALDVREVEQGSHQFMEWAADLGMRRNTSTSELVAWAQELGVVAPPERCVRPTEAVPTQVFGKRSARPLHEDPDQLDARAEAMQAWSRERHRAAQ